MGIRSFLIKFALICAASLAFLSSAYSKQMIIDVKATYKVGFGKQPFLTISVFEDLKSLDLELHRDDGKVFHQKKLDVPHNSVRVFSLPQRVGEHRWQGDIKITLMSGDEKTMKLDFMTTVISSLGLQVKEEDLDLDAHTLTLRSARPLTHIDYEIISENGTRIGQGFPYPIYYRGFGERFLKVPTPDETDELQNRRAEYVLTPQAPVLGTQKRIVNWKKL